MPKLKHLDLEISNPCNEQCVHCYRTCDSTRRGFLSINDVKKIFDEIKNIRDNQINVLITGGEVLLNNEWREIFECCISQNARVSLFTNGSLINENDIDFLLRFRNSQNFREIQISLYSLLPEVHDSITNIKGSCIKSFNAIKKLKAAGLPVFVSCPVMQTNKKYVADLMRWMDLHNIGSCADLHIFPNSDYQKGNSSQILNANDLESFYAETAKNNFELGYVWGYNRSRENIQDELFYGAAANGILVSGDGNIYPMIGWYEKIGNVHENALEDIFLNHPLLERCRQIKIGDFEDCKTCKAIGYCSFCSTPHLTANHGQLGKLNKEHCSFIHLVKSFAERRDKEIKLH